jgi:hypothetical protein
VTSRFTSNLLALLCGAFLAVAAFAFSAETLSWLGLGVGALTGAVVLVAFAFRGRGIVQRFLDVALGLLAAWTIVASRAFAGGTEKWLMLSAAAVQALLAVQGLIVHETIVELSLRRAAERESSSSQAPGSATAEPAQIRVAG